MKVVAPGVKIGGLRVGGLNSEQARSAISWWYNRPLRFVFYGKRWSVKPAALGASVDVDSAVQTALKAQPREQFALRVNVDQDAAPEVRARAGRQALDRARGRDGDARALRPVLHAGKPGLALNRPKTLQTLESALAVARRPQAAPGREDRCARRQPLELRRRRRHLPRLERAPPLQGRPAPGAPSSVATGPVDLSDADRQLARRRHAAQPVVAPAGLALGEGPEADPPGPGNPLGTRWMGLDASGVGMHGTPDAASIGYSASHGCIRMRIPDAEWLFDHVRIGTPVFIVDA